MSSEIMTGTSAPPEAPVKRPSAGEIAKRYLGGEQSQVPVVITLIIIALFFQFTSNGLFLTPRNLSNLVLQIATIGTIGLASALVLFIGEIDLSLGSVAYATSDIAIVFSVKLHWSAGAALLGGLVIAALVGLINGVFIAVLRVPSFIVTLAGLLFYQGVAIHVLLPNTDIIVTDPTIANIATTYMPLILGAGLPIAAAVVYALALLGLRIQRQRNGLAASPAWDTGLRIGITGVLVIGAVALFEAYLGVPQSTLILIGLILLFWLIMRFTAFGRHVYAVGGNAEASRRAGISVTGVRIAIFVLAAVLAYVGGILLASRTGDASSEVDQTLLLSAIATAVIGGVSLFGGRGSVWGVVLGSLVIGSLANGLALLGQSSDVVYMVQGVVLLIAVTADAVLRRRAPTGVR